MVGDARFMLMCEERTRVAKREKAISRTRSVVELSAVASRMTIAILS